MNPLVSTAEYAKGRKGNESADFADFRRFPTGNRQLTTDFPSRRDRQARQEGQLTTNNPFLTAEDAKARKGFQLRTVNRELTTAPSHHEGHEEHEGNGAPKSPTNN